MNKFEKVDKEYSIHFEQWQAKRIEDMEEREKVTVRISGLEYREEMNNKYMKEM